MEKQDKNQFICMFLKAGNLNLWTDDDRTSVSKIFV